MSFPSSGSGYPQQGGTQQQHQPGAGSGGFPQQRPFPQQAGGSVATLNVGVFLALAVTLLGLVNYFVSFSDEAAVVTRAMQFLLIGGLLAALRVLPNGPKVIPFAALSSVLGALFAILGVVRAVDVAGIVTVLLILGILQMLVAVAALLIDYDVVRLPVGGSAAPGQSYGRPGAHPQQGGQGQFPQPTQYGPPVTPANQAAQPAQPPQPAQPSQPSQASAFGQSGQASGQAGQPVPSSEQLTHYASQQGQFFPPQTQQPSQSSQQTPESTQQAQESSETGGKSTGQ